MELDIPSHSVLSLKDTIHSTLLGEVSTDWTTWKLRRGDPTSHYSS